MVCQSTVLNYQLWHFCSGARRRGFEQGRASAGQERQAWNGVFPGRARTGARPAGRQRRRRRVRRREGPGTPGAACRCSVRRGRSTGGRPGGRTYRGGSRSAQRRSIRAVNSEPSSTWIDRRGNGPVGRDRVEEASGVVRGGARAHPADHEAGDGVGGAELLEGPAVAMDGHVVDWDAFARVPRPGAVLPALGVAVGEAPPSPGAGASAQPGGRLDQAHLHLNRMMEPETKLSHVRPAAANSTSSPSTGLSATISTTATTSDRTTASVSRPPPTGGRNSRWPPEQEFRKGLRPYKQLSRIRSPSTMRPPK